MIGLAITAVSVARQWSAMAAGGLTHFSAAQGAISIDGLSFFSNAITLGLPRSSFLSPTGFSKSIAEDKAEYYALALAAQAGMYIMVTASELVTLFLGIELSAICFYILVGFTRRDRRSNEAALKYLLLGGVASGFLLYGFSLLYGLAGSTELTAISAAAAERGPADPVLYPCHHHHRRGAALQNLGRPLSLLGARRLRRRADACHGVSLRCL